MTVSPRTAAIADRLIAAWDQTSTIAPITAEDPGFDVAAGYAVLDEIERRRMEQGWRPVGRKIGFTNRTIWARYGVYLPMWAHVWDTTVHQAPDGRATLSLAPFVQPRIEPEVVFGLSGPLSPAADAQGAMNSVEWIAPGFEIVQSHFPGWKFAAPDCTAALGLHGALVVGPRVAMTDGEPRRNRAAPSAVRAGVAPRRCARRSRCRRERARQPRARARPSRPRPRVAAAVPGARGGRDRHDRHGHRRVAGRARRDAGARITARSVFRGSRCRSPHDGSPDGASRPPPKGQAPEYVPPSSTSSLPRGAAASLGRPGGRGDGPAALSSLRWRIAPSSNCLSGHTMPRSTVATTT